MIDKKRIETEAEHFFAWPTDDRTYVTRTSMLIFANVIAEMARTEEREACAKVCDPYTSGQWYAAEIERLKSEAELFAKHTGLTLAAKDTLLRQALEALAKYTTPGVLGGRVPIDAELVAAIKQHLEQP